MVSVLQTSVEISSMDGNLKLRASGSQVLFPGFLKALGRSESEKDEAGTEEDEGEQTPAQQSSRQQEQDRQARLLAGFQV